MNSVEKQDQFSRTKRKRTMSQKEAFLEHGKLPPQAVDLEEAVLGAMMLEPSSSVSEVVSILTDECFYKEDHQVIFRAIKWLYDHNKPIDILTVTNRLKESSELEISGGAFYVTQLTSRVASSSNVEHHASIVLEKYIKRELIRVSSETIRDSFDDNSDCFDNLDKADRDLMGISMMAANGGNISHISQAVQDAIQMAKQREKLSKEGKLAGVPTGITSLDKKIYGWNPGKLYVLAARPGMGKTALMVHFARYAAETGTPAVVFELEMLKEELADRIINSKSGVDYHRYNAGYMNTDEWMRVSNSASEIQTLPIYIDDKPGVTMRYIKSKAKILQKQGKCGMIFIDYLQLLDMTIDKQNRNREQEVSEASLQAKNLAKDLKVPVVLLCQLSRAVETRGGDKRPILSDLRESGAIEQNADAVMFIYRPSYYNVKDKYGDQIQNEGMLIVAKHRGGSTGDVYFRHNDSLTQIYDYDDIVPPIPDAIHQPALNPNRDFEQSSIPTEPNF